MIRLLTVLAFLGIVALLGALSACGRLDVPMPAWNGPAADSPTYAAPGCVRGTGDACGWVGAATLDGAMATVRLTSHAPQGPSYQTVSNGNRTLSSLCEPDSMKAMDIANGAASCASSAVRGDDFYMGFEDCGHLAHLAFKADAAGAYQCSVECQPCGY